MAMTCPDTGTCHHSCQHACFRVIHCGPLSIAGFENNEWPDDILAAHVNTDGHL